MLIQTGMKSPQFFRWQKIIYILVLLLILNLSACAKKPINQIFLMPAPDVYDEGAIDPFTDNDPIEQIPYQGILYATDREPSNAGGKEAY